MTFVKINGTLYPASVDGRISDHEWDGRESKAITLEMTYAEAIELFVNGLAWSIVEQHEHPVFELYENGEPVLDEDGNPIQTGTDMQETEWDNGEFVLAGDITDHRDGTVTVKMGKLTDLEEAYEIMLGGI